MQSAGTWDVRVRAGLDANFVCMHTRLLSGWRGPRMQAAFHLDQAQASLWGDSAQPFGKQQLKRNKEY